MPHPAELTQVFDLKESLERVGDDMDFFGEIVQIFLDDYPRQMDKIHQAIAKDDPSTLERIAHSIKGAVGNFSASSVYDKAYRLERLGRTGDLKNAAAAFSELGEGLKLLAASLQAALRK